MRDEIKGTLWGIDFWNSLPVLSWIPSSILVLCSPWSRRFSESRFRSRSAIAFSRDARCCCRKSCSRRQPWRRVGPDSAGQRSGKRCRSKDGWIGRQNRPRNTISRGQQIPRTWKRHELHYRSAVCHFSKKKPHFRGLQKEETTKIDHSLEYIRKYHIIDSC